MVFNLKGLVKKIKESELDSVIEFYEYRGVTGQDIMYINIISDIEEQKKYEVLRIEEQKKYVSLSPKIFIPRMGIDNLIKEDKKMNQLHDINFDYTMNKINKICTLSSDYDKNNAYCLYMILHEIGHYNDFVSLSKNPFSYINQDEPTREIIYHERNKLMDELYRKGKIDNEGEQKILDYFNRYNLIPAEKKANDYADRNFIKCFELVSQ